MIMLKNIEEYSKLTLQLYDRNILVETNSSLFSGKLNKLIKEGRVFYDIVDEGILFYIDEKRYYDLCYYLNVDKDWNISRKEKDLVVKNVYVEGEKSDRLKQLEEKIKMKGFFLSDRLVQVEGELSVIERKLEKPYYNANKLMLRNGFSVVEPDEGLIPQIRELEKNIKSVPIYQIPYFSDEEILTLGKEKRIICIVNDKKELCAIKTVTEEKSSNCYVAVKEEYQQMYGLAIVLIWYQMCYVEENNLKWTGWMEETNNESIKFHMNLGYRWSGKYMEEWVLLSDENRE